MVKNKKKIRRVINVSVCIVLGIAVVFTTLLIYTDIFSVRSAGAEELRAGTTGEQVKKIQTALQEKGYYSGTIDGIYGAQTTNAVKRFQQASGLTADGVVGEKTASYLGITLGGGSSDSSNVYLLARLVYAEARGEPYLGQVAVAAVVLNRIRSPSFPNTMAGVIYQPWAFTCVNDGQINLSPNDSAVRAARDALNGWDPTTGCLYYYNPVTATNKWIRGLEIHLTIGSHVFCL